MDLSYSDEQKLLADSANGLLAARMQKKEARDLWSEMAELGWLGLPLPEAHGGLGQGAVETAILAESFGRHLVATTYVPQVVTCGALIAALGDDHQKNALLAPLAEGKAKIALAHAEEGSRHDLSRVNAKAVRDGAGWRLTGRKIAVLGAGEADTILISARTPKGIGVFAAPRTSLSLETYLTLDGGTAARITLDNVALPAGALLGGAENALAAIEHGSDRAIAAYCAECVGLMEAATAATIEYTKIRVQFGKPLAVNQVLRHRMADMSIQCEEARSMALRAALHVDDEDAAARGRAVSGAWAKISKSARFVAEQAIQLHGGMGVTNELNIGSFLKRVIALDAIVGGPDHHLRRHTALSRAARAA